jgi:hypothetical protein
MTSTIDDDRAEWLAKPDTERAETVTEMIGYPYCGTEPVTVVLSQIEISELFKFWEIEQFDRRMRPQLFGYSMSGSQHRKRTLEILRRDEFAKIIGEEAAEKAANEAYEIP